MAKLHIIEFASVPFDSAGRALPIPDMSRSLAEQVVTFDASTPSNAFSSSAKFVRVFSDTKAYLKFGDSPVATANNTPIAADAAEFFAVRGGAKLAVYDGTS